MPPAPLPANETERLAALLRCNVLDTSPEPEFDELTHLASRLCQSPTAMVSLIDRQRLWFKSRVGIAASEIPRSQAFCGYSILSDEPMVIEDARLDPRTCDNPLVTGKPGVRFYVGMPLRISTGEALGTLCVIDYAPRQASEQMLSDLAAIARQVTSQLELRKMVIDLAESSQRSEAAARSNSMFLANMSHEVRTPLTAILGYADLLADSYHNGTERQEILRHLSTIRRSGQHLLSLLNDVLDAAKLEARGIDPEIISISPVEVARDTLALFDLQSQKKNLELRASIETDLPAVISTDPHRLRQILNNLMSNAVKFTESGKVTLRLGANEDSIWFRVEDTGIGINEARLGSLFVPFAQAELCTSQKYGGTGLGLAICQQLSTLLGGELFVESAEGKGSAFTLELPRGSCDRVLVPGSIECAKVVLPERMPEDSGAALTGARVMLVEDSPDIRRLVSHHLNRAGATVTTAEDGREALDLLAPGGRLADPPEFDVVIMDINMPNMDGLEATRRLRALGFQVPIVALSAHSAASAAKQTEEAGCDTYLSKPIHAGQLLHTLEDWLSRSAMRIADAA